MSEQEIALEDIFGIIRKRLWLILLAAMLAGGVSALYWYIWSPDIYTAESILYVLQTYQDSSDQVRVDTSASTSFAADYKELIKTLDIQEQTAREVGLAGVEELNSLVDIDIDSVSGTRVLSIVVKGEDKQLCTDVANVVSQVFVDMVTEKTNIHSLDIIANARVPEEPSGPPRIRNTAIAAALGAILCFVVLFVIEILDNRISSEKQVENILQQPLLATVVDYRNEIAQYYRSTNNIISLLQTVTRQTQESVRVLATNIQFAETERPIRTMALTSSMPGEGKSSLSLLTAQVMAEENMRVLVVDMDFKNPSIGRLLKKRNDFDLVDYLSGKVGIEKVLTGTFTQNLYYIDSNHRNISLSRVVKSRSFDQFLDKVKGLFDMVIFDTPPLGMFIDAAVLSAKLDGAVMVVAINRIKANVAGSVINQIDKSGPKTIGVVLNYAELDESTYKKYGYYYT